MNHKKLSLFFHCFKKIEKKVYFLYNGMTTRAR